MISILSGRDIWESMLSIGWGDGVLLLGQTMNKRGGAIIEIRTGRGDG